MSLYHDQDEALEVRLRKQQKHLRAKLKNLELPSWFDRRLKEDTGRRIGICGFAP